jgi:hypothetical protein
MNYLVVRYEETGVPKLTAYTNADDAQNDCWHGTASQRVLVYEIKIDPLFKMQCRLIAQRVSSQEAQRWHNQSEKRLAHA